MPGYDVSVWWGVLGPAKMPPEIVAKLETDLKAALQDPNVLSTLGKIGAAPVGSSSREFDAYMHAGNQMGAGAEGRRHPSAMRLFT